MNNTSLAIPHVFQRYSVSGLLDTFAPVAPMAERVVPPIWYLIGFIGNPLSAVIWFGKRMRRNNSSAVYLGALSVSDFCFLILHLVYILHVAWGYKTYNSESGCEVFNFFFYVPQYLSTMLVLGFTVERYIAVVHPFLKEKWCTVKRACIIVAILVVFAMIIASAQTFIWFYYSVTDTCNIRMEAQVGDPSFYKVWTWFTEVVIFIFIPLLVLVFNVLVLKEIFKLSSNGVVARQSGGSHSTTASTITLLAVSFYLIITQLTTSLAYCLEQLFPNGDIHMTDDEIRADPDWSSLFTYLTARKIIDVINLSHYACYVFIYALTGKHFRKEVLYILTCFGRSTWLDKTCSKTHRGERYSMVTGNGNPLSETCTTTFTTNM